MTVISKASSKSLWRGIDICENKKIVNIKKINDNEYSTLYIGRNNKIYNVFINKEKTSKSNCSCPFANGKK